jgi:C-8 sterol isomerase
LLSTSSSPSHTFLRDIVMAFQSSSNGAPSSQRPWATSLTILAAITALLSALVYYLNSHLEDFYIFTPPQLHDLSLRAIGAHGNDTRAVVAHIVGELSEKLPGGYVNLDEEWIFNNAGGAMGAMYIIHASKLHVLKMILWGQRGSRGPLSIA